MRDPRVQAMLRRSRHNILSTFIFNQDYYELPKRTIRANGNIYHIFKPNNLRDVPNLYQDKAFMDMSLYDVKELLEPITKTLTDTNQNLLDENRSTTKASKNLDESYKYVKTLELMNKNEVIHSSLIRPIAKLLVPKKSQFRLIDDPDSYNWKDYIMHGKSYNIR